LTEVAGTVHAGLAQTKVNHVHATGNAMGEPAEALPGNPLPCSPNARRTICGGKTASWPPLGGRLRLALPMHGKVGKSRATGPAQTQTLKQAQPQCLWCPKRGPQSCTGGWIYCPLLAKMGWAPTGIRHI